MWYCLEWVVSLSIPFYQPVTLQLTTKLFSSQVRASFKYQHFLQGINETLLSGSRTARTRVLARHPHTTGFSLAEKKVQVVNPKILSKAPGLIFVLCVPRFFAYLSEISCIYAILTPKFADCVIFGDVKIH